MIDIYSRYGVFRFLKNKTAISVVNEFVKICKELKARPKYLWVDEGKEFINKVFRTHCKEMNIKMYYVKEKPVFIERLNRTIKSKIYRLFTEKNNQDLTQEELDEIMKEYNNKVCAYSILKRI